MSCFSGIVVPSNVKIVQRKLNLKVASFKMKSLFLVTLIIFHFTTLSFSQNAISVENAKQGAPKAQWDIVGKGDLSIQGFATTISVNKGQTISFKIKTDANNYKVEIYRLGYYNGNGARLIGQGTVTAALPQKQPLDGYEVSTGKTDCSNWGESAIFNVPSSATSGLHIAKLTRLDNGGSSHIFFVVRNDSGNSNLLFKTSDATWQAYNNYGGNSLYENNSGTAIPGFTHATKVSYNRPFYIRTGQGNESDCFSPFNAEYPMIRWLERNGYDVSYTTDADMNRDPAPITPSIHKVLMSVGHDEYWAQATRTKFENARNAGVHLAFFSGNEMYWRTRWEDNSRTIVCYKEGKVGEYACGSKCDPLPNEWTGLWREGCGLGLANACQPENALSGQMSWIQVYGSITVPDTYKDLRFWRNTSVANLLSGQTATFSNGTLGYEWDYEQAFSSYPAGRITMSSTTLGGQTHKLSLYRHSSGALVFGAGSIQWSWGLDGVHDRGGSVEDARMQQATINLFADMGVQPASLQTGLIRAVASNDVVAPQSIITPLAPGTTIGVGNLVTIKGTATDVGGIVAGIEISLDGGATWQMAKGTTNWSYDWIPSATGDVIVKTRSFDDIGNIENIVTTSNVLSRSVGATVCPCYVFKTNEVPFYPNVNDGKALEVGVKFQTSENGVITGLRFYKGAGSTGTHLGHLWTSQGTLLSEATFVNETVTGWQQVFFSTPVTVQAGVTYVASMFSSTGDFALTNPYFDAAVTRGPITLLANGTDGPNGIYKYSTTTAFPMDNYLSSNYWVDVIFDRVANFSITNHPASIAVCAGSPAIFSVQVSNPSNTQYKWQFTTNDLTWNDIAGATTAQFSLTATTQDNNKKYRVLVTNNSSTLTSSSALLTVDQVNVSVFSKTNASCTNGSITMTQSGGTAPYSYSINGGPAQSSSTFNNLVQGTYQVVVADNKGCTATVSDIQIIQMQSLQLILGVKTNANCNLNDGTISVNALGGLAPYTYSKDGVNFQESKIFNGLASGTYTITVKDNSQCLASLPGIVISNNSFLSLILASKTDATCGLNDGKITVEGSCGAPPYMYILNTGFYQSTGAFTNLATGTYNVYIVDSKNNVEVISGIVIAENKTLALSATTIVNAGCANNDGSVTLTATGGKGPYQYKLGDGAYKTSNIFSGLSANTYSFSVKDYNGCITTLPVTIGVAPSTLQILITDVQDASCAGGDGSISVNATGGGGGYLFNINYGVYGSSKTFKNLEGGIYIVSVKDSKGCIKILGGIEVKKINFVATVTGVTGVSCKGNDGIISISTIGGTSSYLYSINGDKYDNANHVIENVSPGTYYVAVKDAVGCIAVVRDIVVGTAPVLTATASLTNACKNINNGSITTSVTGGEAPYQYSLSGAGYKSSNVFSNLSPGTYYVRVKDANGCMFTVSGIRISRLTTTCSGRGYESYVTGSVKNNVAVVEKVVEPGAKMILFPNPSNGSFKLNIKGLNGYTANVVVVDALGKEIFKFQTIIRSEFEVLPINLDRIHKGVYFIKLSTNKFSSTEKLVIY